MLCCVGDTPKRVVDFLGKETYSETESWKSSRISSKQSTITTVQMEIVEDFACEAKFLLFYCSSFFFMFFVFFFIF